MKKFIQKYKLGIAGMVLGAIAGYLYWKYIGCLTGTCAITSNPVRSTAYFGIMGGLIFSLIPKQDIRNANPNLGSTE